MTTSTRKHCLSNSRHGGFTIVELMITVCLAAILFAIAIPSFRRMIAVNRLVTQTNEMIGALNYARSEAITRNRTVMFCRVDAEADTACVTSTGNWSFWIVRNAAGVVRRGSVPTYGGGIKVVSGFSGDTMNYGSDGLARNGIGNTLINNETFTVCSSTTTIENIRTVTPGSGSRLTTARSTGPCT